jgi:aryl carrier-like protein
MSEMQSKRAGTPPTLDELRALVAEMIGSEPGAVPLDANLNQLGVDSLGMMRLANRWRRAGVRVSFKELAAEPTLAAWQRHLNSEPE